MADNFDWNSVPDAHAQTGHDDFWNELADAPNKPIPNTYLESALRGAEQGGTFGFNDEIRGALGATKDVALDHYTLDDLVDRYRANRDEARRATMKAREDNPKSFLAGEVAGSVGSSFIPGIGALGAAKGATLGARALSAAKGGAVLGGLTGLGSSDADLTKGNFGGALDDVKTGAETGAIAGGLITPALDSLASGIRNFIDPENLRGIASDRAVKAATGQNLSALRKIAGTTSSGQDIEKVQDSLRRTGRDLIDSGVISAGDSIEDLAPKLAEQKRLIGSQIGDVGAKIDELSPKAISGETIADKLLDYASTIPPTSQGKLLQEKILNEAENFKSMGGLSFADAQKVKNQFKYKPMDQDALISNQDVTNKIQSIVSGEMDDTAAKLAASGDEDTKALLGQYGDLKGQYRSFKGASDASSARAIANLNNRYVSPSDYGAGATGAVVGALTTGGAALPAAALGLTGAALNKVARERGNSVAAVGLSKAADALENSPQFAKNFGNILYQAAQRGGPALAVTHELLKKSNPSYVEALGGPSDQVNKTEKKTLSSDLHNNLNSNPEAFGKFAAPLQSAAARGPTSLGATNFILQQTNPEYRKLVLGSDNDDIN